MKSFFNKLPWFVALIVAVPAHGQEEKPSVGGKEVASFSAGWGSYSVAVSPDGKLIYSANYGGYHSKDDIVVIDVATGKETTFRDRSRVTTIALSPDGKRLACAGARGVTVYDTATFKELLRIDQQDKNEWAMGVAFSPDGKRIISGGGIAAGLYRDPDQRKPGLLKVHDAETGKEILDFKGHTTLVTQLAVSRDGKRIVSGSWDGTAKVWDANTGKELFTLTGHKAVVRSVAISPDGKRIVTVGGGRKAYAEGDFVEPPFGTVIDGEVKLWDAETGKKLRDLKGLKSDLRCVAFSPDGKRIVAAGYNPILCVWNAETGRVLARLGGKTDGARSVTFSRAGKQIISGCARRVRVWELDE